MSPRTVERVDDWETVPFGGGYGGLRDLASQEFSGVVTAGPSRLFMIRGTVIGILDGAIDDFEDAGGTARQAPHAALPLLAVMQERSDEVRAQYYTEETPIADVDRTLEDGGFTGYVELSENVLSGDYYQVYHQGRSMSVAYVGSSERLITDDDAFEQANDEVGIYEVRPVDIEVIDVPEPADDGDDETEASATAASPDEAEATPASDASAEAGADASDDGAAPVDAADTSESGATSGVDESPEPDPDPEPETAGTKGSSGPGSATQESSPPPETPKQPESEAGTAASTSSPDQETDSGAANDDASAAERASPATSDPSQQGDRSADRQEASEPEPTQSQSTPSPAQRERDDAEPAESGHTTDRERRGREESTTGAAAPSGQTAAAQTGEQRASGSSSAETAGDLEMRSIPSLDPSRTEAASKTEQRRQGGGQRAGAGGSQQQSPSGQTPSGSGERGSTAEANQGQQETSTQSSSQHPGQRSANQSTQRDSGDGQAGQRGASQSTTARTDQQPDDQQPTQSGNTSSAAVDDLESQLEARERELEDLRTDLERVEAERDELESTRSDLETERDRLQSELEEARTEIEHLEERLDDFAGENAVDAETQLSATEAIDNTNLFVRYRSKGDATLESAHANNADRAAVSENLRLEYHTQFDADNAAVGNEPFDDFLTDTISYRFVEWLVENLLYEIRDTGHADGMADLYNALPKIDRAELNGQVSVTYTENGDEHRTQERFDIVVRDRMGNPLVVANINDSRDPATDSMMTDLVKRAERVGESSDSLAGAFLVTASFFEPEALETADEATSSGLFSRDKRKSFVNLSRKGGYHLCLVEARNQEFHLAVPEL